MNGEIIPDDLFALPKQNHSSSLSAQAASMLQNITFVQFIHRSLAVFIALSFLLWWHFFKDYIKVMGLVRDCVLVAIAIFVQFILGVLTLIYHVPLPLALAHHLMALALWFTAIKFMHGLSYCNRYIK